MSQAIQTQLLSSGYWQKIDFFRGVPPELLKNILIDSEIVETVPKKIIFYEGDKAEHFGFVIAGVFKLYRKDSLGLRVAMDFVQPGGIIAGLLMAAVDSKYPVSCQSMVPGKFLKIPKSAYTEFWSKNSDIMNKIQIANMERVQSLQRLREAQRLPLEQRVAWVILKQLTGFAEDNKFLNVYFSRVDLADATGAAPESVIRVFSKWLKEGLIITKENEEFVDLEKLNGKYFEPLKAKI